jgi:FtsZ-interacting cell division protein ZipA
MIAWLVGIITLILLLFVLWRSRSKAFRERAERPKFKFLENLGIRSQENNHELHTEISEEKPDGKSKP